MYTLRCTIVYAHTNTGDSRAITYNNHDSVKERHAIWRHGMRFDFTAKARQ